MADKTHIQWTDATWNPVRGCSRISTGCGGPNHQGGCYAEKIAARFSDPGMPFHGYAERTPHGGRWTGKLGLVESALTLPLRWRRPRMIFVNSMSDLMHEALTDAQIDRVFGVMALAPRHAFQVLTKRSDRMRRYCNDPATPERVWKAAGEGSDTLPALAAHGAMWGGDTPWPLRNVWLGVSVEDQPNADERVPDLLATPAAVCFLSCEPLLGRLDLTKWLWGRAEPCALCSRDVDCFCGMEPRIKLAGERAIQWVITGQESGPGARFCDLAWERDLRDQCVAADVPFFLKQHVEHGRKIPTPELDGRKWIEFPNRGRA